MASVNEPNTPCPFMLYREHHDGTVEFVGEGVRWSDDTVDIHYKDMGAGMWTPLADGRTIWSYGDVAWHAPKEWRTPKDPA